MILTAKEKIVQVFRDREWDILSYEELADKILESLKYCTCEDNIYGSIIIDSCVVCTGEIKKHEE